MEELLERAHQLLGDVLAHEIADANDVVSLVLTGEATSRIAAQDDVSPEVETRLRAYREALVRHADLVPIDLDADLDAALHGIRAFAAGSRVKDADETLRDVDGVLMVARAAMRAGRLERSAVLALADRAAREIRAVAPDCVDLWDEAERRSLRVGSDPEVPELTEWLDALASLSRSRVALELALARPDHAKRQARLAAARALFDPGNVAVAPSSAAERHVGAVVLPFRKRSTDRVLRAAAADAPPPWDDATGTEVCVREGMSVRVRERPCGELSEVEVRVAVEPGVLDLSTDDTVIVLDAHGERRNPVEHSANVRLWTGYFAGEGTFIIAVGGVRVAEVRVERPT